MSGRHRSTPPADAVTAPLRPGGEVALRPDHLYKTIGLLFLLALLYRFFDTLSQLLLLIYAASIVAVLLNAMVRRLPLQRAWVAALIGLVVIAATGVALWFALPALFEQGRNLAERIPAFEAQIRAWGEWVRARTGLNIEVVGDQTLEVLRGTVASVSGEDVLIRARGLLEILFVPVIILFGALFAVANPNERLLSPLLRAVPRDRRLAFRRMLDLLGERILGWLQGTLIAMVSVGVISVVVFSVLDVPNALLLGLLAGLAEVVPFAGPWAAGILATLVAFLDDPTKALWTALAALAIQQVESNLITPWAMSRAAKVHPFVTLFSLVIFGSLFGFLGVLLALPLVLLFWTVIQVLWVERAIDTDEDPIAPVVEE